MKEHYYVNNDQTRNPGLHHEVHTEKHANELNIKSKTYLGYYDNCYDAVEKAKKHTLMQMDLPFVVRYVIRDKDL